MLHAHSCDVRPGSGPIPDLGIPPTGDHPAGTEPGRSLQDRQKPAHRSSVSKINYVRIAADCLDRELSGRSPPAIWTPHANRRPSGLLVDAGKEHAPAVRHPERCIPAAPAARHRSDSGTRFQLGRRLRSNKFAARAQLHHAADDLSDHSDRSSYVNHQAATPQHDPALSPPDDRTAVAPTAPTPDGRTHHNRAPP